MTNLRAVWLAAALAVVAMGCEKKDCDEPGGGGATGAALKLPKLRLSAAIPGDAALVIAGTSVRALADASLTGMGLDADAMKELWTDVGGLVRARTGFDITAVGQVNVFLLGDGTPAVILLGAGAQAPAVAQLPVASAVIGSDLVLGLPAAVEAARAAARTPAKNFVATRAALMAEFDAVADGGIVVALAEASQFRGKPEVAAAFAAYGVERAVVALRTDHVLAKLIGDPAGLGKLQSLARAQLGAAVAELERQRTMALTNPAVPLAAAVGMVMGADVMRRWSTKLDLAVAGRQLKAELDYGAMGNRGGMMIVPTIGILAAVAIPSFLDYMQKGKRSEAELNLNAIGKAADAEFAEHASFPATSVGLTPSRSCCEFPGKKCPAVASDWQGVPAWDALGFELTQPSYFQYSYQSDGKTYEARAVGDLDCDGVTVEYVLHGAADHGSPTSTLTKPARPD